MLGLAFSPFKSLIQNKKQKFLGVLKLLSWAFVLCSTVAVVPSARADEPRKIVIAVIGDSMADGLWGGLFRALHTDPAYSLPRLGKTGSGLSHLAKYDWVAGVQQVIEKEKPDIVVVSIGLNDRGSLIKGESALLFGSNAWKTAYAERVDSIMEPLKKAGIPTYWMGFPTIRDEQARADVAILNKIFMDRAAFFGHSYLPMWTLAGTDGAYEAYLTDDAGRRRLLRADDGIHFTAYGYDLLAEKLRAVLAPKIKAISAAETAKANPAPAGINAKSAEAPSDAKPAPAARKAQPEANRSASPQGVESKDNGSAKSETAKSEAARQ